MDSTLYPYWGGPQPWSSFFLACECDQSHFHVLSLGEGVYCLSETSVTPKAAHLTRRECGKLHQFVQFSEMARPKVKGCTGAMNHCGVPILVVRLCQINMFMNTGLSTMSTPTCGVLEGFWMFWFQSIVI